jgi:hypothetical protein
MLLLVPLVRSLYQSRTQYRDLPAFFGLLEYHPPHNKPPLLNSLEQPRHKFGADLMTQLTIRPRYVAATVAWLLLFAAVPFTVPLLAQLQIPNAVLLGIIIVSLVFVTVYGRALTSAYRWVELDDDKIRTSRLLMRRIQEWKIREILTVKGIGLEELGLPETADENERMGYEIEFRDGAKLLLSRHEMGAIDEFLLALADQIKQDAANPDHSPCQVTD